MTKVIQNIKYFLVTHRFKDCVKIDIAHGFNRGENKRTIILTVLTVYLNYIF